MDIVFGIMVIVVFAAGGIILDRKNRAKLVEKNEIPFDFVEDFFTKLKAPRKQSPLFGWKSNSGIFKGHEVVIRGDDCRGIFIAVLQVACGPLDAGPIEILKKSGQSPAIINDDGRVFITGDEKFDCLFQVTVSDELAAVSLLGPDIRRKITDAAVSMEYFHFTEKQCSAGVDIGRADALDALVDAAHRVTSVIGDIRAGCDNRRRLMENLRRETVFAVKMHNLKYLTSAFQADREIRDILISLLNDTHTGVQFEAACHLDESGMKHITRLLKKGKLTPGEKIRAVAVLGRNRYSGAIPVLLELYVESDVEMKVEILRSFQEFVSPGLEGFLAGETRVRNRNVRLHAVKALARCGTVGSVEMLHRLAGRRSDPVIAAAARESMRAIQERLVGKKGGWLSVSETGEMDGALSRDGTAGEGALSGKGDDGK